MIGNLIKAALIAAVLTLIVQSLPDAMGRAFDTPAYFNNRVYFLGSGDALKSFSISGGSLSSTPVSQAPSGFGFPGATVSVSANGLSNGIVWAIEHASPSVLHAYDATTLTKELYNSNQAANSRDHFGAGNKFITPTVADGKVFVGTTSGVAVFGLLH